MSRVFTPFPTSPVQQPLIIPQQAAPAAPPLAVTDLLALLLNERRHQRDASFDQERLTLERQMAERNLALQERQFNEVVSDKVRVGIRNRRDRAEERLNKVKLRELSEHGQKVDSWDNSFNSLTKMLSKKGELLTGEDLEKKLPAFQKALKRRAGKLDAEGRRYLLSKGAHFLDILSEREEDPAVLGNVEALSSSIRDGLGEGGIIGNSIFDTRAAYLSDIDTQLSETLSSSFQRLDSLFNNASTETLTALDPVSQRDVLRTLESQVDSMVTETSNTYKEKRKTVSEALDPALDTGEVFADVDLTTREQKEQKERAERRAKGTSLRTLGEDITAGVGRIPQSIGAAGSSILDTPLKELNDFLYAGLLEQATAKAKLEKKAVPTLQQIQAAGPQASPFYFGGMR